MWICVIYVNSSYIIIFVMQNKKTSQNFTYSSFATCHVESRWQSWNLMRVLCHLPRKAVGKEPFATC